VCFYSREECVELWDTKLNVAWPGGEMQGLCVLDRGVKANNGRARRGRPVNAKKPGNEEGWLLKTRANGSTHLLGPPFSECHTVAKPRKTREGQGGACGVLCKYEPKGAHTHLFFALTNTGENQHARHLTEVAPHAQTNCCTH
jgi:hypothetical protein